MKLCRFDDVRLGIVEGENVLDVSDALDVIPPERWPLPAGDPLIRNLAGVLGRARSLAGTARRRPLGAVRLNSPVANPTKIIGAPINYREHIDEARRDAGISHGREIKTIGDWGLFLKATTSLIGPGESVRLRFPDRRNDHEVELALVIGKQGTHIPRERALEHVCGYAIGLDMTVRGPEVPSFRKSIDTYSVLGPWLVTSDEIANPNDLALTLAVNGEVRQQASTRLLDFDCERLIEFASSFYTLYPGDVIMTGTPAGVGPVQPGDLILAEIAGIGRMEVRVTAAASA
ncbi:MAG: fumarylacetoacetate hydrolase family protein [Gammaproteobacteria bacterium]|nr:fumarylacetoacetate hydrolase family protein [Gammaproteobacteria bacterium]